MKLIFQMVIPFLTQPPHKRTLTGRGSRVYPKVGAAGYPKGRGSERTLTGRGSRVYPKGRGSRVAWSGQEVCSGFALAALAARCMNSYYTICIKNVRIGTKTTPCTNSY
jgi:hypothetical protein